MRGLRTTVRGLACSESDPRWQALAEGRLSDSERAALEVEAMQTEEGRGLWEMYRPFNAEEDARLVHRLEHLSRVTRGSPGSLH
jgi:hypothetical protein